MPYLSAFAPSPPLRSCGRGAGAIQLGGRIGLARSDYAVRLWDAATGKELAHLDNHTALVNHVLFTADGRRALSCGADGSVRLWQLPK